VTILVIFIHQSFLQYISFHSMWVIQRETEWNSVLGSSWSSFCGTFSLISQLIYDDIAKMFHLTASRKWFHLFPPSSCKKQINKQNSYLLLAFLQSGCVPELDMYESKHFLLGPFVHSVQLGRFKNRTPARFEYIYWDHTKKRPGQPETARSSPGPPGYWK
jgi:hypothetical protein